MIAISMRMMIHRYANGSIEYRDALAHDWWYFFSQALPGQALYPLPNIGCAIREFLRLAPSALILSGGEDWGVFPQRDRTETELFNWAIANRVPVLGICRGAQVINRLMGGKLRPGFSSLHTATRHAISFNDKRECRLVNSFHANAIMEEDLSNGLIASALAEDGSVEAFSSANGLLQGILWHPEREAEPHAQDIKLLRELVGNL